MFIDFPGEWGGLSSERRGSTSNFYGFDQQANSRILVSIGGNITDSYLYKAFGEELAASGTTVNPMRFGGQVGYYRDIASRLYVRARHLRADLGRWMSRDPIGFSGGINIYRYGNNDPLKNVDPSGLKCPQLPSSACFMCWFERFSGIGWSPITACEKASGNCLAFIPGRRNGSCWDWVKGMHKLNPHPWQRPSVPIPIGRFIKKGIMWKVKGTCGTYGYGEEYERYEKYHQIGDMCQNVWVDMRNGGKYMHFGRICNQLIQEGTWDNNNDPWGCYGNEDCLRKNCVNWLAHQHGLPDVGSTLGNLCQQYYGTY